MTGFIHAYVDREKIMDAMPPWKVPAITTLAKYYTVFNRYYASIPGQTVPNRWFFYSATSDGYTDNDAVKFLNGYDRRTIFEQIDDSKHNKTWAVYFGSEPPTVYTLNYVWDRRDHVFGMETFYKDVSDGHLANFVFIEPDYATTGTSEGNDQEPPHNVAYGDQLIKRVYEAIRNSVLWENTLLIIMYDEHGGFPDHIPPPYSGIPPPDDNVSPDGFKFDMLGLRVPFILVSPWVEKGGRVGEPGNGTHYEHSSMSHTLINMLIPDMPFLTARDKWAAPFDWVIGNNLTGMRPDDDCPRFLPLANTTDYSTSSASSVHHTTSVMFFVVVSAVSFLFRL